MKQQDKKKAAVLAVLLGALAVYWTYHLFFEKTPAPHAPAPAAQRRQAGKAQPMATIKVDLGLLGKPRPGYTSARNIFSPVYVKPALVRPTQQPKGKQQQPVTVTPLPPLPPPPPPKSPAEIAAENAREEIKKIKVLGFLKRKGKTDVFMSLGGEHYTVPAGGNITKDYFLTEVGQDFVVIKDNATGVAEKVKTQLSSKPSAMPGGGAPAGGAKGGGIWSPGPQTGSGPPAGRAGAGGGVAGTGGGAMIMLPQTAPTPLVGRSLR